MGAPRRSRGRGPQLRGWRIVQIREAILSVFGLSSQAYSLTQLRCDLRKIKAHACWSVPADPTATGHPQRHPGGGPLRFSSTSASVALSPTACSTAAHSQPRNRRRNRNGLTPKLTGPQSATPEPASVALLVTALLGARVPFYVGSRLQTGRARLARSPAGTECVFLFWGCARRVQVRPFVAPLRLLTSESRS